MFRILIFRYRYEKICKINNIYLTCGSTLYMHFITSNAKSHPSIVFSAVIMGDKYEQITYYNHCNFFYRNYFETFSIFFKITLVLLTD